MYASHDTAAQSHESADTSADESRQSTDARFAYFAEAKDHSDRKGRRQDRLSNRKTYGRERSISMDR